MSSRHRTIALGLVLFSWLAPLQASADQPDQQSVATRAAFADVVFEIENAIVSRGLTIHSSGNQFARMLDRTGTASGSDKQVYKDATFIEFCSAKHARTMVEAEPDLMSNCPFIVFAYELAERPGEVMVGYRRLVAARTAAGREAVAMTEALLAAIVKDSAR